MDKRQSRSRGCVRDVATAHTRLDGRPGDVATASVRGATRPGPTRRSREPPPSRSPSTTHAHFERARAAPSGEGVAPCTSARSRVLPPLHPNASEPKLRDPRAPPWEVTVPTDRYPHDPSLRHATIADHRPLVADPSHPMFPPEDRDRVGRPDGYPLCRHRRRRPRHRFAPPSLPAQRCVRGTAEAATLPQHPASACR